MEPMETLTVQLPADVVRTLREAIDGRRYTVLSDVLVDALADWQVKQQIRFAKLQRLRHLLDEGEASGFEVMGPDEIDHIIEQGRAELAARKAAG